MKSFNKSIFNLIEIFRTTKKPVANTVIPSAHCDQKYHHDFYCDAEKPFIENF